MITPAVTALRDRLELPGMVVLEWAFDSGKSHNPHHLENHRERSVVYTATHDQQPITGWWQELDPLRRRRAEQELRAADIRGREPHWNLIRLAFSSRALLAMVQAQDVLGLGAQARMNTPGRARGNWRWQLAPGALTPALARRLRSATEATGRLR